MASILAVVFISCSVIGTIILKNKVKNSTILYKGEDANLLMEIEKLIDDGKDENSSLNDKELENENVGSQIAYKGEVDLVNSSLSISLLGEIMLGGDVEKNLENSYVQAIKSVYIYTRLSDFTYANFTTNIVNTKEELTSDYTTLKESISFLRALGIDSVSIASDHMIDLGKERLENTIGTLNENNIYVAGKKDSPVYFEKNGRKIAIVSTNSIFNASITVYDKMNISSYSKDNLSKNIKEAKEYADIVIADIHWGNEFKYGVTDTMRNIATFAIDSGADMVIGTHAAGVYPIVKYKDKPIIYSLGYFIGDSDLYVGKESFIFNLNITTEGKIDTLEMIPIYINGKEEVLLYNKYNEEKCKEYLEQFNNWNVENSLDSKIVDDKIIINF